MKFYKVTAGYTITITNPFTIGWICILLGLFIGLFVVADHLETLQFLRGSLSTQGTIIQCNTESVSGLNGSRNDAVFPVVRFQTQIGQRITFEASESDGSCLEGNTVTVRYHPNNPEDARLNASNEWLWFSGIGLAFILLGLFNFLRGVIRKARGDEPIAQS